MKKTIAFTICANNYLAHANVLAKSFKKHHPDIQFYIAIVDEPSNTVNYKSLASDQIKFVNAINIRGFKDLSYKYKIAELCTVVKPELILQFFANGFDEVIYLDPDIEVFNRFNEVFLALSKDPIVFTPHMCSPTPPEIQLIDRNTLRTGIFNLGFVALKKTDEILKFVKWWDQRVRSFGNVDAKLAHFYDQIWMNAAPVFLEKLAILRDLGYNVANWNLHERELIREKNKYYINSTNVPLKFFHFSHFKESELPAIAKYNKDFTIENRSDIRNIYLNYARNLKSEGFNELNRIPYVYGKTLENRPFPIMTKRIKMSIFHFKKAIQILLNVN